MSPFSISIFYLKREKMEHKCSILQNHQTQNATTKARTRRGGGEK